MISVIVPVYNVEEYLDECVQSLVDQTYSNLEIILVDDGSTDNSGTLCDIWASKDERIKVIHQKNSGGARGGVITGVKASCGRYIAFLDSDDWYLPHSFEIFRENIIKYDADLVEYEYLNFYGSRKEKTSHRKFEILSEEQIKQQALKDYFRTGRQFASQWSYGRTDKLYKAEIVKQIIDELDPKITIYEDMEMNFHIANVCKKAVILENCHFYCWRRSVEGSISKRMIDKTIDEHLVYLDAMEKFATENGFDCSGVGIIRDSVFVDLMVMALFNNLPLSKKISYLKRLKKLVKNKKHITEFANNHAFITCNALRYVAHFDCVVPSVLSQIYLKIKK
ncbi:MAG: glycosyltransferase family 2 protein [Ruminococcaceae bacterium]|nr:glycosyltransferase family 2 protein [Oscillospiraceae bacterium]